MDRSFGVVDHAKAVHVLGDGEGADGDWAGDGGDDAQNDMMMMMMIVAI